MKQTFRFYKTVEERWYIDYPAWKGSIADLEMVEGADTMLDKVAGNQNECFLELSDELFEGADVIKLVTDRTDSVGGGDYIMESYKEDGVKHEMWLCAVTVEVFGNLPTEIFVGYPVAIN
jgi:hypothetical protein